MLEELVAAGASGLATAEVATEFDIELPEALLTKLRPGPGRPATEVADHQRARIHGAVLEIVGERGYEAVTSREVTRRAGVSTRAYYEHFGGKDECFLRTHELVVRRLVRSIAVSQATAEDWEERLRLTFMSFVNELGRNPHAARLVFCDACGLDPAVRNQMLRARRGLEARIAAGFAERPDGTELPPLVIEGVVYGVQCVANARLNSGRGDELHELGEPLAEWAGAYHSKAAALLADFDIQAVPWSSLAELHPVQSRGTNEEARARSFASDRALLLSATTKLAASGDCGELTVSRIRMAAGVSRRSFEAHFERAEDCFVAAVEEWGDAALAQVAAARTEGASWADGVHRAIASLCGQVASSQELAELCFGEAVGSGSAMHCREPLVEEFAEMFRHDGGTARSHRDLTAEAIARSIWEIVRRRVVSGRADQLPGIAPVLSHLALAPFVDRAAAAAIGEESGWSRGDRQQRIKKRD